MLHVSRGWCWRTVFAVVALSIPTGIGKTAEPKAAGPTPSPKFDSPEACFEAMVKATDSGDPAALIPCLSEAMVNYQVGFAAFNLQRIASIQRAEKASTAAIRVLEKHGLAETDMMEFLQIVDSPEPGGATPGFMQIGDSVKDKKAFLEEAKSVNVLMEEAAASEDVSAKEQTKFPPAKLVDVKIVRDKASATVDFVEEGLPSQPWFFKREGSSWVMSFAEEEPDWRKPIKGRFHFRDLLQKKDK